MTWSHTAYADAPPPVRWTAAWPQQDRPDAEFPPVEGAEHFVVFHSDPQSGPYNHHAKLAHLDGVFYAAWSNHPGGDEDGPGQRVRMSLSTDGRTWSPSVVVFPSLGPVKPAGQHGRTLVTARWIVIDDAAYLVAAVSDTVGFSDSGHTIIKPNYTKKFPHRTSKGVGALARRVAADGTLGPMFWLNQTSPEPLPGFEALPAGDAPAFTDIVKRLRAAIALPLNAPDQVMLDPDAKSLGRPPAKCAADDGHHLCEPSVYRRPDGVLVCLRRDLDRSLRMYASMSADAGATWSAPTRTNIPDSPSLTCAGTLPDGRVYLIGNQLIERSERDPLTIATSRDGVEFDQVWAIRTGAPPIRHKGKHKSLGFQYPAAVVVGNALWVLYSIGKEDMAVTRVPLSSLANS